MPSAWHPVRSSVCLFNCGWSLLCNCSPQPMMTYWQLDPQEQTAAKKNTHILFHENAFENVICKMSVTLFSVLTHWGRVTHICVGKLTILGSDNGLSPGRHQAIVWTNAGILLIGPLGTNSTEILIKILEFSFKKMRLKLSSAKWRPFCLGLNVLMHPQIFVMSLSLLIPPLSSPCGLGDPSV